MKSVRTKVKKRTEENLRRVAKGLKPRKEISCPRSKQARTITLDKNLVSIHKDHIRLTTTGDRREKIHFDSYPLLEQDWHHLRRSAELVRQGSHWYICLYFDVPEAPNTGTGTIGVDRGITNIAVVSDNRFYNSKKHKEVKARYQYKRQQLQSKGTRSAKRLLRSLSGRENRFVRDYNHCISKSILTSNPSQIVLEDLKFPDRKRSKSLNRRLGSWSFSELGRFLTYKARLRGTLVTLVAPQYTSQRCSRCGHVHKQSRRGSEYHCVECGFRLHSDLNAARNIALLANGEMGRAVVNIPNGGFGHQCVGSCA
jgi:IS605 OrfB family transposase